jgi:hypothetical protein
MPNPRPSISLHDSSEEFDWRDIPHRHQFLQRWDDDMPYDDLSESEGLIIIIKN